MLVVVGGHSRNIGKTSVAAAIIRALPHAHWTAVKITQHGHGICSAAGEPCSCAVEYDHPYALSEQTIADATDSGRFLSAGAARAYWLRTAGGQLGHAMPALRRILDESRNTILESNSVLQFLRPTLYLVVLDFRVADIKDSLRAHFDRADAFVITGGAAESAPWCGIPARWLERKPQFRVESPGYMSEELAQFIRSKTD